MHELRTKLGRDQAIELAQQKANRYSKPFVAYFSRCESTDRSVRRSRQVDVWLTCALSYWECLKQGRRDHVVLQPQEEA